MTFEFLNIEIQEQIATVSINRPEKLNALNKATLIELGQMADYIGSHSEVRGVILTGSGEKAFVAGADIEELQTMSGEDARSYSRIGQMSFSKIEQLNIPVIAAVNGYALGGGCELAMACHLRIASDTARFGLPEINLGLIPGFAGTQRLPRLIGRTKALELLLTGDMIKADEAANVGLINRVVPASECLNESRSLLEKILSKAPIAASYIITTVRNGASMAFDDAERYEAGYFGLVHTTNDAKAGCEAFLKKEKPVFKGL